MRPYVQAVVRTITITAMYGNAYYFNCIECWIIREKLHESYNFFPILSLSYDIWNDACYWVLADVKCE